MNVRWHARRGRLTKLGGQQAHARFTSIESSANCLRRVIGRAQAGVPYQTPLTYRLHVPSECRTARSREVGRLLVAPLRQTHAIGGGRFRGSSRTDKISRRRLRLTRCGRWMEGGDGLQLGPEAHVPQCAPNRRAAIAWIFDRAQTAICRVASLSWLADRHNALAKITCGFAGSSR